MSTNNERCEVVTKLREHAKIARKVGYACVLKDCTREEECDGFGLGGCEGCFSKSLTRLADLIEPERTCRMEFNEEKCGVYCSYCGKRMSGFVCSYSSNGTKKYDYPFCCKCGAKVVDK